jgi:hypothetical protein
VRWQFGVLAPRAWVGAVDAGGPTGAVGSLDAGGPAATTVAGSSDTWHQQTECLLEADPSAVIQVRVRFLHLLRRSVQTRADGTGFSEVDALEVAGTRHLTFEEAVPREIEFTVDLAELAARAYEHRIEAPGGEAVEPLGPDARIVRTQWPVTGRAMLSVADARAPFPLRRLRLVTENTGPALEPGADRSVALRASFVATHSLLRVRGGSFLSALDPPTWALEAALGCRNIHTFPVLAGAPGSDDVVLSAPIILYDHPQIAPESPGDLFDATEIDEILSLRTMTLTDAEKREARATDPRAAAILDRLDVIPDEVFARLHGAVRSPGGASPRAGTAEPPTYGTEPATTTEPATSTEPAWGEPDATEPGPGSAGRHPAGLPWWHPRSEATVDPDTDTVVVEGVPMAKGARVRLRPRARGGDAHDMFLAGRTATVEAVLLDVDGSRRLAVTLDDDPGADLHRWYGRYYYFSPDEVSPLTGGRDR